MPDVRPPLTRRVSRTLNRVRARGVSEVLTLAGQRIREWWSSQNALIMLERDRGPLERDAADLTFRQATAADAPAYARDIGTDSRSSFTARLRADVCCFVVESDGRLLHSSWVTTSAAWTREIKAYMTPPAGDIYVYESFTRADARGRGIYPFALAGIVTWADATDKERVWVAVEAGNEASRRAIGKAGFEEAFTLPFSRRLGRVTIGPIGGPKAALAAGFVTRKPPPGV